MFFKQFPKTTYSIENDAIQSQITDYFRYVDVVEKFADDLYAYQNVDIIDGERPDNLSQRLYGTPDYYWTFFIANDDLKSGLTAWPKSDFELSQHITNQFKSLSAFRFPIFEDTPSAGDKTTPLGIPITNENYLPYLRLCLLIDTLLTNDSPYIPIRVFANAKIVDFKPNLSQIWIDKSTLTWSSDYDPYNDQVGDGGIIDTKYSARSKTAMFNTSSSQKENYSIQFFEDSTTPVGLKTAFIQETLETATSLQPSQAISYRNMSLTTFANGRYQITNSQFWQDAKNAPAYYLNGNTEYMSGPESTAYVSYEDEIIEKNNARRTIKVVAPPYIDSFAQDYKRLLNE